MAYRVLLVFILAIIICVKTEEETSGSRMPREERLELR